MYLWSKYNHFFIFLILLVSCQSKSKYSSNENLALYLVELGDRAFKQKKFKYSYQKYISAKDKNHRLSEDIFFLSRVIKNSIKLNLNQDLDHYYKILKYNEKKYLNSTLTSEVFYYLKGKYFQYYGDIEQMEENYHLAIKVSNSKRINFYQCLLENKINCEAGTP